MSQSGQPKGVAPTSVMCIAASLETQSGEAVHSNAIFFCKFEFSIGHGGNRFHLLANTHSGT